MSLDDLLTGFVADELSTSPVLATSLGAPGHDHELPDLSADAVSASERRDDEWAARFAALDPAGLGLEEGLDRDLVLSSLRGRAVMRDWQEWRRSADLYVGAGLSGVHYLELHRPSPPAGLAASIAARLEQVPAVLAAGRANLDPELASPLLLRRALAQARGGAPFLRDAASRLHPDVSEGARRRVGAAGEAAGSAYDGFCTFLEELAGRATGDWAIGEVRYSALLREREGLSYDAAGLRERGRAAYAGLEAEMTRLAAEEGAGSWRELVDRYLDDHPDTPEEMLAEYAAATEAARQFCRDRGLVTLPAGERCEVVPSPPFSRATLAVASYYAPPALSPHPSLVGHFNVPYPPAGASAADVRERLAGNARYSIPTTAVHEAYPGHHWQLARVAAAQPRPVRSVLRTAYFVEGWALYAEQTLADAGFFATPAALVGQVDARMFRAARIVVDTSLHLGEMTVDEAVEHMSTRSTLPAEVARAEVGRYCAWPTQAASYLTGALEIAAIRDRYLAAGRGDLRTFHDTIGACGGLPLALADRAVGG